MGSTRLPNKVLKEIAGQPLLWYVVNRVKLAKKVDKVVVATSGSVADDAIEWFCREFDVDCFRGSENDVLDRYFQCSLKYPEYQNIVRITGDCPLIDPAIIDRIIEKFTSGQFDYVSNVLKPTFPDGLDAEIFTRETLETVNRRAKLPSEREHVTTYIIFGSNNFKKRNLEADNDYSNYRLTVDNIEDFEVVEFLIKSSRPDSGYLEYISLLDKNPEIKNKNSYIKRNEGLAKSLENDPK